MINKMWEDKESQFEEYNKYIEDCWNALAVEFKDTRIFDFYKKETLTIREALKERELYYLLYKNIKDHLRKMRRETENFDEIMILDNIMANILITEERVKNR